MVFISPPRFLSGARVPSTTMTFAKSPSLACNLEDLPR